MNKDNILVIEHLVKKYGDFTAVNDISLHCKRGEFFAFLGINGAGKSTTINVICSILKKDQGKIYVDGLDLDTDFEKIKSEIGIVFQTSVLDEQLTVKQNLDIRAAFYGQDKATRKAHINTIVDLLELHDILNKQINQLSGGQKRRVDIARAMVHSPKLLILDEPTTGLDPKTRKVVWNLINKIRTETKMTVFLTTHYLEEAEKAGYVTIMDHGKIIAEGTPVELKNQYAKDYLFSYSKKDEAFEKILNKDKVHYYYNEEKIAYKIYLNDEPTKVINKYKDYIKDYEVLKGTMDDVFLAVTNNTVGEEDE